MTWLWIGLGVWIGMNVLYFAVRYALTFSRRDQQQGSDRLPLDAPKRKSDVNSMLFS